MNPPPDIEDDYIAEFNARRKYSPESVITFTDFGIPELTENMVRKMITSGKIILSKFENIKICSMGNLIRKIQSSIRNNTQSYNMIRSVLSLKDSDIDEFIRRKEMMERLIATILEEQVTCSDEPQTLDEPCMQEPKAKEPKAKEPKAQKAKEPKAKEPKAKEPKAKESKAKEPKAKEPKAKEPKADAVQAGGEIKVKKQSIPKKVKDDVWNTYIGEGIAKHKCLCCKMTTIDKAKFDCGHVVSEKNGGTLSIRNLRPVCNGCNLSMGSEDMIDYVKKHEYYIG